MVDTRYRPLEQTAPEPGAGCRKLAWRLETLGSNGHRCSISVVRPDRGAIGTPYVNRLGHSQIKARLHAFVQVGSARADESNSERREVGLLHW